MIKFLDKREVRILVYEANDNLCYVEYDLPSTLFGQFGNERVSKVGFELDKKIAQLIALADQARIS